MVAGAESILKHDTFTMSVAMGWDVLDRQARYVFEGSPRPFHDPFDFVDHQGNVVKQLGLRSFTFDDLVTHFAEDFVPLLVSIVTSEALDGESLAIVSISSPSILLDAKLLAGWERQYGVRPKSVGAYYFLHSIPPNSAYEVFFLLPRAIAQPPTGINLMAPLGSFGASNVTITADPDKLDGIQSRIRFLEMEIKRLRDLLEQER
jgi:hypothetical protein